MINSQRQRELAMQVTRFLDKAQDFPSGLTDEETAFVDRLIAVQEMLLADQAVPGQAPQAATRAVPSAAAQHAEQPGVGRGQRASSTGAIMEDQVPEAKSKVDESTETSDDGSETIDDRSRD